MIPFFDEIENVKNQIISLYHPEKIILFGSCAKGIARMDSDIDLCVIINYKDKKNMLMDMLLNVECERDVDFILYKPEKWQEYIQDKATFASLIEREGILIYG